MLLFTWRVSVEKTLQVCDTWHVAVYLESFSGETVSCNSRTTNTDRCPSEQFVPFGSDSTDGDGRRDNGVFRALPWSVTFVVEARD
jgi:hypothetical protein